MGGPGSGTWYRWNTQSTLEEHKRIDIGYLNRQGYLCGWSSVKMSWSCGGEETGSVQLVCSPDQVQIVYRVRDCEDEDWEDVRQAIGLEYTPCNFGGRRPWFTCPGCQRRVGVLVCADTHFACRQCYQLPYA